MHFLKKVLTCSFHVWNIALECGFSRGKMATTWPCQVTLGHGTLIFCVDFNDTGRLDLYQVSDLGPSWPSCHDYVIMRYNVIFFC